MDRSRTPRVEKVHRRGSLEESQPSYSIIHNNNSIKHCITPAMSSPKPVTARVREILGVVNEQSAYRRQIQTR